MGMKRFKPTASERFFSLTSPEGDCLIWKGYVDERFYGRFKAEGKSFLAHRYAFILAGLPLPEEVHHKCKNTLCVKLDHLEPTTHIEHPDTNGLKTHCKNGHEFTPENTFNRKNRLGKGRLCKQCAVENRRKYHMRQIK
jgi:hypothetical protein